MSIHGASVILVKAKSGAVLRVAMERMVDGCNGAASAATMVVAAAAIVAMRVAARGSVNAVLSSLRQWLIFHRARSKSTGAVVVVFVIIATHRHHHHRHRRRPQQFWRKGLFYFASNFGLWHLCAG